MKHAETVTFGGSGLDRAAELRGDAKALAAAMADGAAASILLWRGKPLVSENDLARLERVAMDHPIVSAAPPALFLGREADGTLIFAHDLSAWVPDGLDEDALGQFLDQTEQHHPQLPGGVFAELRRIMTRLSPRDAELAGDGKGGIGLACKPPFLRPLRRGIDAGSGRVAAQLRDLRRTAFPKNRPRGYHADHTWKLGIDGPLSGMAGRHVFSACRVCRTW